MQTLRANDGYYELEVMTVMYNEVKDTDICLDVGANIGVISIALAAYANLGHVFSFEALPQNYLFLKENLRNNFVENCEAIKMGLFSRSCSLEFNYVDEFAGGGFTSPLGVSDQRSEKVIVQCTTLDEWVDKKQLMSVDLIKVDVEGSELDVIVGAEQVIKKFEPKLIVEVNPVGSRKFFGQDLSGLFAKISSLYPKVYLISREDAKLIAVSDFTSLTKHIEAQGGLGDLICKF